MNYVILLLVMILSGCGGKAEKNYAASLELNKDAVHIDDESGGKYSIRYQGEQPITGNSEMPVYKKGTDIYVKAEHGINFLFVYESEGNDDVYANRNQATWSLESHKFQDNDAYFTPDGFFVFHKLGTYDVVVKSTQESDAPFNSDIEVKQKIIVESYDLETLKENTYIQAYAIPQDYTYPEKIDNLVVPIGNTTQFYLRYKNVQPIASMVQTEWSINKENCDYKSLDSSIKISKDAGTLYLLKRLEPNSLTYNCTLEVHAVTTLKIDNDEKSFTKKLKLTIVPPQLTPKLIIEPANPIQENNSEIFFSKRNTLGEENNLEDSKLRALTFTPNNLVKYIDKNKSPPFALQYLDDSLQGLKNIEFETQSDYSVFVVESNSIKQQRLKTTEQFYFLSKDQKVSAKLVKVMPVVDKTRGALPKNNRDQYQFEVYDFINLKAFYVTDENILLPNTYEMNHLFQNEDAIPKTMVPTYNSALIKLPETEVEVYMPVTSFYTEKPGQASIKTYNGSLAEQIVTFEVQKKKTVYNVVQLKVYEPEAKEELCLDFEKAIINPKLSLKFSECQPHKQSQRFEYNEHRQLKMQIGDQTLCLGHDPELRIYHSLACPAETATMSERLKYRFYRRLYATSASKNDVVIFYNLYRGSSYNYTQGSSFNHTQGPSRTDRLANCLFHAPNDQHMLYKDCSVYNVNSPLTAFELVPINE
jgi:hypothetical protein